MILVSSSPKDALKIFQPFLPISAPIGAASLVAVACFLALSGFLSLGFGPERLRPVAWVLLGACWDGTD